MPLLRAEMLQDGPPRRSRDVAGIEEGRVVKPEVLKLHEAVVKQLGPVRDDGESLSSQSTRTRPVST